MFTISVTSAGAAGDAEGLLCARLVARRSAVDNFSCVACILYRPIWLTPGSLPLKFIHKKRLSKTSPCYPNKQS